MKCPLCQYKETKVVDSRLNNDGTSIRRRRECLKCEKRFTTYEYVEQVPLMVVKSDSRRQAFNRAKILSGIVKACEKRPISMDKMEEVTSEIERTVQKKYDRDHRIGHSYFMELDNYSKFYNCWYYKIIPLLMDYFYNDLKSISWIIGKSFVNIDDGKINRLAKKEFLSSIKKIYES